MVVDYVIRHFLQNSHSLLHRFNDKVMVNFQKLRLTHFKLDAWWLVDSMVMGLCLLIKHFF